MVRHRTQATSPRSMRRTHKGAKLWATGICLLAILASGCMTRSERIQACEQVAPSQVVSRDGRAVATSWVLLSDAPVPELEDLECASAGGACSSLDLQELDLLWMRSQRGHYGLCAVDSHNEEATDFFVFADDAGKLSVLEHRAWGSPFGSVGSDPGGREP